MNTPFVDLLHRDEFSLKQALGNTKTILPILKERNQKYYAVSNYCEISNWVQQLFTCKDNDIVPILGMEAFVNNFRYQADGFDKINVTNLVSNETKSVYDLNETERDLVTLDYPIDLFARTLEGYYNIIQIHNDSQLYGVDKRPRTSDPFLEKHCKGIIAVLPTPFSEVASLVFNGMEEDALVKFRHYQSLFDKVYLTVSLVDDPEYKEINESIIQFAQKNNILVVPVCCSHYHMPSDEEAFFTLKKLSKLRGGMFYEVDTCKGMFYRSREDVDYLFEKKFKSEIFTEEVYKKLIYNLDELLTEFSLLDIDYSVKLPKFENGPEKLKEKAWAGFIERGYDKKGPEYLERFNYEIENIVGAGFADYFLVLEEVFNWYRKDLNSVSAIGRGSAGGSLVLNCIGCTSLDPIQNNLLFERFLDASRLREVVEDGGKISGCFPEDTIIKLKDRYDFILNVRKGDYVISYSGEYQKVLETFENGKKDFYKVVYKTSENDQYYFEVTLNHVFPIYRDGQISDLPIEQIVCGKDRLVLDSKKKIFADIVSIQYSKTANGYDLEIENKHYYRVCGRRIL